MLNKSISRILPILLLVYIAASLIHFVHNAEFLADYPNLPISWTRSGVYCGWIIMTIIGIGGWILISRGYQHTADQLVGEVQEKHDGATMLFNNAGVALAGFFDEVSDERFDWLMQVNFHGPVRLVRAFLPMLKAAKQAHRLTSTADAGELLQGDFSAFQRDFDTRPGAKASLKTLSEENRLEADKDFA